jgi:hypothetical protein
MLLGLVAALLLVSLVNVACAWVVAFQVSRLIAFIAAEPNAHPIREHFSRLFKREVVATQGLRMRA